MFTSQINHLFWMAIVSLFLLLSNCSDSSEYGKASDFEKYGAVASGTIKGSVLNSSGSVLSGVSVNYVLSGITTAATATDSTGDYSQSSIEAGPYTLYYSKSGYLDESQTATLTGGQTIKVSTLKMLPDSCDSTGDIEGKITDAVDSSNISGAALTARRGLNTTSGTVTKTTNTASNGTYTLADMPRGWYTIQIEKSGYIDGTFEVYSCGDKDNQNSSISESLSSGTMRIILSWPLTSPQTGTDLDSHLTGPASSGRFHVYYPDDNKIFYYSTGNHLCGSCSASEINDNVTLDRDENPNATGAPPGIETVTVRSVRSTGTYRYSVHDYSNDGLTNSDNMSKSGAYVRTYYNNGTSTISDIFNAPNSVGNLWTVFTFTTSGGFSEIGTMSDQGQAANIQ